MDKWKIDFIASVKAGKDLEKAASSAVGLPLDAVLAIKDTDPEFASAWDEAQVPAIPVTEGFLMPELPDTDDIKELCQAMTVYTSKRLFNIAMYSENEKNALTAIGEINDRAYGRPGQSMAHSGSIDIGLAAMLDAKIASRTKKE